jgi:ribosomal 50S subunit-associated protein YjgA (DUF615 family)
MIRRVRQMEVRRRTLRYLGDLLRSHVSLEVRVCQAEGDKLLNRARGMEDPAPDLAKRDEL